MTRDLTPRESEMVQLRASGASHEQLAVRYKRTPAEVEAELRELMRERHPDVDPEIGLELERLDTMNRAVWKGVLREEPAAVNQALAIGNRRREVLAEQRRRSENRTLDESMQDLLKKTLERSNKNQPSGDTSTGTTTPTEEN